MKKILTSTGALTFSIILLLALGMTAGCGSGSGNGSDSGSSATAHADDQPPIPKEPPSSDDPQVDEDENALEEIITEFCEDVLQIAQGARNELTEATNDKLDCVEEFHQCRTGEGFGGADTLTDCLIKGNRCTSRANDDLADACREFSLEFKDSYGDANRRARRNDVEDGFVDWLNTPSPERRACLRPAIRVSRVCAGLDDE